MSIIKKIWTHLVNWKELYGIFPVTIILISLSSAYYAYITGHNPTIAEGGVDWIPAMTPRIVIISVAIIFTSFVKECIDGYWLTKEEALGHPWVTIVKTVATCFLLWLFIHTLSN
jgi:hypothetical protein